jgi:hypothetical protein
MMGRANGIYYIYNFFKFQKCHCLLELKYEVIIVHVICGIKIMLR